MIHTFHGSYVIFVQYEYSWALSSMPFLLIQTINTPHADSLICLAPGGGQALQALRHIQFI